METTLYATFTITPELIEVFISDFARRSRSQSSVSTYQKRLQQFYDFLPAEKTILPGTLRNMRESLISQGVPNRSINLTVSVVNSFLDYFNRRDLQLPDALEQTKVIAPELTRTEYLRLLSAAKALDKERAYLLVKVFANTGLYVRELEFLTVEAVRQRQIAIPKRGIIPLQAVLCRELTDYCLHSGQDSGPVFVTQDSKPIHRSAVNTEIRRLSSTAKVDETKCNPLTLRRLYLATREQIMSGLVLLVEQSHERLLETEQLVTGWNV